MNRNKITNCLKGFALGTLLATLVFAGAPNILAGDAFGNVFSGTVKNFGPSVSTTRYGGVFVINGNGFQKGDIVTLTASTSREAESLVSEWQIWADANGEFVTEFRADSFATPTGKFIIRAIGSESKTGAETEVSQLAEAADLDQCANGPFSAPVQCTNPNWENGNLNDNKAHYFEGDSLPYRMKLTGMTAGSTGNTLTIEWDTTKAGKHAIDYLTTYNRTESVGNDPCSGVVGSHCVGAPNTFPIPIDPNVAANSAGQVTQIPGQVFSIWGGTITSVSSYTTGGSYAGDSETLITLTFTASVSNPVIAWAGHIADRNDWANFGGSASNINGSPYHMRLIELNGSGGNQDRALQNAAVRLDTRITIIKQANPPTAQAFAFTTTGAGLSNFSLVDNSGVTDASTTFNNLLGPLGSATYTVTEGLPIDYYVLQGLTCSIAAGGTGNTSVSIPTRTATLNLNYGDVATCTFVNNVVTAATTHVAGRVVDSFGNPLARTLVSVYNTATGETREAYSNQLGTYRVEDLAVGDFYVVTVSNRRYTFVNDSSSFTLNDAVEDLNFTGFAP